MRPELTGMMYFSAVAGIFFSKTSAIAAPMNIASELKKGITIESPRPVARRDKRLQFWEELFEKRNDQTNHSTDQHSELSCRVERVNSGCQEFRNRCPNLCGGGRPLSRTECCRIGNQKVESWHYNERSRKNPKVLGNKLFTSVRTE